jgi:hypothetical protein
MKRIITVIVALSFFVPHAAKMMAYVDCSFVMLSNSDPDFCDCNLIVASDMIPLTPDMPDKQKELSLKADWKYVVAETFTFTGKTTGFRKPHAAFAGEYIPQQSLQSIFHPPRC